MSAAIEVLSFVTFRSELGWFGVIVSETGVRDLAFGYSSKNDLFDRFADQVALRSEDLPEWWTDAQKLLVAYAAGEAVDLTVIPIDQGSQTRFQRQVVESLRNVGYGETVSYAELAERAGSPRAARAVGNQMRKNRLPILIPCHRVVGSGGRLGGFSAPQGLTMKRRLLNMESDAAGWEESESTLFEYANS